VWGDSLSNIDFSYRQGCYKGIYLFSACRIWILLFGCLGRRRLLSLETHKSLNSSKKYERSKKRNPKKAERKPFFHDLGPYWIHSFSAFHVGLDNLCRIYFGLKDSIKRIIMPSDENSHSIEELNFEILHLKEENQKLRKNLKKERRQRLKITKILVVDDSVSMQEIILEALIEFGFKRPRVKFANNGQQALKKLYDELFDLIISDWHMPGLTGLEFVKKVREHPDLYEIPFLMMTVEDEEKNILKAASSGVDQYMLKPFEREDLREKIFQLLG